MILERFRGHPPDRQRRSTLGVVAATVPSQALVAVTVVPPDAERSRAQIELEARLTVVCPRNADMRLRRLDLLQVDRHPKVADLADAVVVQQDVSRRKVPVDDLKGSQQFKKSLLQTIQKQARTFLSAMYSMPRAMSWAKPVSLRGERGMMGVRLPWIVGASPFTAPRAARSRESRRPRMAYSMISSCGSAGQGGVD